MTTIVQLLDSEVARLNDRKTAIDNAEEERKRIISLTSSAVERQKAYNNLYIILVIILIVVVCIKLLYQFQLVPNTVLDIIITLVVSGGLIYSIILYDEIEKRSKFDFSQINLGKMPVKSQDQIDKDFKSGNLSAIVENNKKGQCNGASCCTSDQTYNEKYSVCVPNAFPAGTVATAGSAVNSIKYGSAADITKYPVSSADEADLTTAIIRALSTSDNYKYCRFSDDDYEWLPVTEHNLMRDSTTNKLVRVMPTDPNWVGPNRTTYVAKTLSTNPLVQGFTTMESKSALTEKGYTKYM